MDEDGNFNLKTTGRTLEGINYSESYSGTLNSTQLNKVKKIFNHVAQDKKLNSNNSYKFYYDFKEMPVDENTRGILFVTLKGLQFISQGSDGPGNGITYEDLGNNELDLALGWLK